MSRVLNFGPGPSTLPLSVLESVQAELLDFQGTGISIMEHSHRGAAYDAVHRNATARLLRLTNTENTHTALFMTGGATQQATTLAANLFGDEGGHAAYVDTGKWSQNAFEAGASFGDVAWAASGAEDGEYTNAPLELSLKGDERFLHVTSNATIRGVQYLEWDALCDAAGEVPLVVDMSSDALHDARDLSRVSIAYAGAQKNLGIAGVTIVLIKNELIETLKPAARLPNIGRYAMLANKRSLINTPPTFPIYVLGKVLEWLEAQGGRDVMGAQNREKARLVYGVIDAHNKVYDCPVRIKSRSRMNAVFRLPTDAQQETFLAGAEAEGMVGLRGHRSVGGVRVSMYNSMPLEGVRRLVDYMERFAASL